MLRYRSGSVILRRSSQEHPMINFQEYRFRKSTIFR